MTFTGSSSVHPIVATGPISGWFEADLTGDRFAPGSQVTGRLEIAIADLRSGNPLIDAETRRRVGSGAGSTIVAEITETLVVDGATVTIVGDVEVQGETVALEGELTVSPGPVLSGEGQVDMRWWGVKPPRLLTLRVHPELVVRIEASVLEQ